MMNQLLAFSRSLIIFAFLLTPLLAYLLIRRQAKPETSVNRGAVFAFSIALISALTVVGISNLSRHWPEATQVVWTGLESDLNAFAVGGPREGAVVGWPNGSFTPSLRALSVSTVAATLEVDGGGAFIWDHGNKTFFGGKDLSSGNEETVDGFRVRLISEFNVTLGNPFTRIVEVRTLRSEVLANFNLPATSSSRDRVLPIQSLVEAKGAGSPADAERLVVVGKWAADKRLLLARTGETRLLGTDAYRVECKLPCDLTVHWPGQRLPLRLHGKGGRIGAMFLPPWRIASPLPPQLGSGERKFTLTATPRPDDVAFVLPFGHLIADRRPSLTIGRDSAGRPVFTGPEARLSDNLERPYLPPDIKARPNPDDIAANETSRTSVWFDRIAFTFATVNDLPGSKGVALMIALALVTYGIGLLVIGTRSPDPTTRWVVYGLSACLWNLLLFRLLLALRFALDPTRLDYLTVKGVTLAFTALAVGPGLLLLWARMRADLNARLLAFSQASGTEADTVGFGQKTPAYIRSTIYLGVLIIAGALAFWLSPRLWSNPPATPSFHLFIPFILLAVYLFFVTSCIHLSYLPGLRRSLRLIFIVPIRFDAVVARHSKMLWAQFAYEPTIRPVRLLWWIFGLATAVLFVFLAARLQPASGFLAIAGTLLALGLAAVALLWLLSRMVVRSLARLCAAAVFFLFVPAAARLLPGSMREVGHEVVALFVFGLIPALFWLSLVLIRRTSSQQVTWFRLIFLATTAGLLPVFVMPKFLGDMGSAFATIPLFCALAIILAFTPAWRASTAILVMLLSGVLLAGLTYRYFSSWLPGAAEVRLVTYWQGSEIERLIPWARATREGEGISLQNLRAAYQHGWESRAIAHEGGWFGVGFGNAPNQLSQVRQDTIQFDSLFSFFVAGEHGLVGGLSLLLLFAIPFAIVRFGTWRTRTDLGYAAALLVFAWLFLEAVLHAGMNLGTFPFTGRGMPLVNVNSTSDLFRWLVLFAFAAQLLHWRDPDGYAERAADDIESISSTSLPEPSQDRPQTDRFGKTTTLATTKLSLSWLPRVRRAVITTCLALVPLLLVTVGHGRLILNDNFPRTFEWAGVLARVRSMIQDEMLTVNQNDGTIQIDRAKISEDFNLPDGALLKQEILRFNALPLNERLDEQTTSDYRDRLRGIATVGDYDRLIEDMRLESLTSWHDARPSLFRLLPPERQTDGITVYEVGGYRLTTNAAFNSRFSFRAGSNKDDIPRVSLSDGETLIGPAWVGGRWITVFAPEHSIPWTLLLARTLTVEQNCFGKGRLVPCRATLTLNLSLHEAATRFVSSRGRNNHEQLLNAGGRALNQESPLPPRVALTVLSVPAGETLVVAGYPRMTSSPYWQRASGSGEWLPPVRWVEQQAPSAVRSLYGGDRNFDRIVVGSATKPLWAAAVLEVHPRLNDQLRVRGDSSSESDVFGIELSSPWHVTQRRGWIDFPHYLSLSDNRYHVRLGFLGLADDPAGDVRASGDSPSNSESLRVGSGPVPWRKYPYFSPQLQFSHNTPNVIANLNRTPLASHLERMFSINPGGKRLAARVSFWTGNEEDDRAADTRGSAPPTEESVAPSTAGFAPISPAAPNLRLDTISTPRDYVSLLLGGRTNLWSNVDLAAAFVTSLTGKPFGATIISNHGPIKYSNDRESFLQTARKLRPGLAAVITEGTFREALLDPKHDPAAGARALAVLESLNRNYSIYAKTGTLQTTRSDKNAARYTSRVVLAIVKWDGPQQESVTSGLVFSFIAEMTEEGNASRWLGQFIVENEKEIRRLLQTSGTGVRV